VTERTFYQFSTNDLNQQPSTERDEFSVFLFRENLKGPIYMDCRQVPTSFWERNPWRRIKFDFRKKPLAISPAAHFFMGGVRIDERGQTSLPGLFGCGEVVWGLHGANRMGGNAVTECVVFGRIAGYHAAQYALTHTPSSSVPETIVRDQPFRSSSKQEDLKILRKRIRQIAWEHAGIIRSEAGLKEGLAKTDDFKREVKRIVPRTVSENKLKEELLSTAFVLKAVILASSARTETRGSFYRDDFPKQDDLHWRKNSCLTYGIETDHFTITHFPPS
jgi:succinate dehydrogenase/fumarate reductase flavoprotein subunit